MRTHTFTKAALLITVAAIAGSCSKKIEFTYTEVEVTKQDVTTTVTATGTIEPVTSVLLFDRTDLRGTESVLPWFFLDDNEAFKGKRLSARVRIYDRSLSTVADTTVTFTAEGRVMRIGTLTVGRKVADSGLIFFVCYHALVAVDPVDPVRVVVSVV